VIQNQKESDSIELTPLQEEQFRTAVKIGIYKELHRKGLLSDEHLTRLILKLDKYHITLFREG